LEDNNMKRFDPISGTVTNTAAVIAAAARTKRKQAKAKPALETLDTTAESGSTESVTVTNLPSTPPVTSSTRPAPLTPAAFTMSLARSAIAIPLATYVCRIGNDCDTTTASVIRAEFATWCEQQPAGKYATWREAWTAYETMRKTPHKPEATDTSSTSSSIDPTPANVVPFTAPDEHHESDVVFDQADLHPPTSEVQLPDPANIRRSALLAALC
jgi:hypothetical protein